MFFDRWPLQGESRSGPVIGSFGPDYELKSAKAIDIHLETTRAARERR